MHYVTIPSQTGSWIRKKRCSNSKKTVLAHICGLAACLIEYPCWVQLSVLVKRHICGESSAVAECESAVGFDGLVLFEPGIWRWSSVMISPMRAGESLTAAIPSRFVVFSFLRTKVDAASLFSLLVTIILLQHIYTATDSSNSVSKCVDAKLCSFWHWGIIQSALYSTLDYSYPMAFDNCVRLYHLETKHSVLIDLTSLAIRWSTSRARLRLRAFHYSDVGGEHVGLFVACAPQRPLAKVRDRSLLWTFYISRTN